MPEDQRKKNDPYNDYEPDPEWRLRMRVVGILGFGLVILWNVCYGLEPKDFWTVFIGGSVNLFILSAMIVQAYVSRQQWKAMREALEHNKANIEIAKNAFEMTDRPWLAIDVILNSPLTFNDQGGSLGFIIIAKNVGRSVAVNATINPSIFISRPGQFSSVIEKQTEICKNVHSEIMSYAVFPSDTYPLDITFNFSQDEIDKGKIGESNLIQMYIVGCVDYQFSGHERHHQTRFVYEIMRTDTEYPAAHVVIDSGESCPLERLVLRKTIMGRADYAD